MWSHMWTLLVFKPMVHAGSKYLNIALQCHLYDKEPQQTLTLNLAIFLHMKETKEAYVSCNCIKKQLE